MRPLHIGHHPVRQDKIGLHPLADRQGVLTRCRLDHVIAGTVQLNRQHPPLGTAVIDQQDQPPLFARQVWHG